MALYYSTDIDSKIHVLTLSQTKPCCYISAVSLLETLWEKEKLLLMSNFSFSSSVVYSCGELSAVFIKHESVSANSFSLEESTSCRLGKGYVGIP